MVIICSLVVIVVFMGIVFCWVVFGVDISFVEWFLGMVFRVEEDVILLVIGLIGIIIVFYNLFLVFGLSQGQSFVEMCFGLILVIFIGGLIILVILFIGGMVSGVFLFEVLVKVLDICFDGKGYLLFGIGFFMVGLSSVIIVLLVVVVMGKSLLGSSNENWNYKGCYFWFIWGGVLLVGLLFVFIDVKFVLVIIVVQVLNGLILLLVVVFLMKVVNDVCILLVVYQNLIWLNIFSVLIVGIIIFLGFNNIWVVMVKVSVVVVEVLFNICLWINVGVSVVLSIWMLWSMCCEK